MQYVPYPEPTFAESALEGLAPLSIESALPDPVPVAAPLPMEPAPVSPRRVPDLPAAPPEPKPEPAAVAVPAGENPASVLPPPAPPEAPPRSVGTIVSLTAQSYPTAKLAAPMVHAHFAKHLGAARSRGRDLDRGTADARGDRADDQRDVLGEPSTRGGLRPKDLDGVSAARAHRASHDARAAPAARARRAHQGCGHRRTCRHPPGRVGNQRRVVHLGNGAQHSDVLFRARGRRAGPDRHQASPRRAVGQVRERRGARRRSDQDRRRKRVEPSGLPRTGDVAARVSIRRRRGSTR